MTKVKFKTWVDAMRLRTLPLALSSVLAGAAVVTDRVDFFGLTLAMIIVTTLLLQILSNLANDYGDSQHGTDNSNRVGPMRTVQSGAISKEAMKTAIFIVGSLAFISGLTLLYLSFIRSGEWSTALLFLVIGLGAIAAAIKYTAGDNPYGYRGLGDASVFIFFGLIGVSGSAFLLSGSFLWHSILPALSIGCFATAVLNLNNMRDFENDRNSGKRTLVVFLGLTRAKKYHTTLFIVGWTALLVYIFSFSEHNALKAALAIIPIHAMHLKRVKAIKNAKHFDPELKKIALSTFFMALLLLLGSFL